MSKPNTKAMKRAYGQMSNDQLAAVYMEQEAESRRINRILSVIKSVAQQRMEDTGLRVLPTDGPVRIKGHLFGDLAQHVQDRDSGAGKSLLIKRVSFEYKDVVEDHQERERIHARY